MPFLSAIADKVIDITSSGIVAFAIHVPFLLGMLIATPLPSSNLPSVPSKPIVTKTTQPPASAILLPSASTTQTNTSKLPPTSIHELFNWGNFFPNNNQVISTQQYFSSSTKSVVSFGNTPNDELHRTRNPGFSVYINQEKIGETGGNQISIIGFSPDQKFFVIRENGVCGAMCERISLDFVDIANKKLIRTDLPRRSNLTIEGVKFFDITSFPESFSWDGDTVLQFLLSYIGFYSETGEFYRVSPKEIWNYDIPANSYSFKSMLLNMSDVTNIFQISLIKDLGTTTVDGKVEHQYEVKAFHESGLDYQGSVPSTVVVSFPYPDKFTISGRSTNMTLYTHYDPFHNIYKFISRSVYILD